MSEVVLTEKQLQEKLHYWQEKLRLKDWIVKVKIVRQREMSKIDGIGEIQFSIHNKTAMIYILDPVDYDDWEKQDMENTLVHELLHLHFSQISYHFGKDSEVYEVFEEQAIESIAHGLIEAERSVVLSR